MTLKTYTTKEKISKSDSIKILEICISKNIIKKVKGQPIEWEKTTINQKSSKGLAFKIYKEFLQLNIKKTNDI